MSVEFDKYDQLSEEQREKLEYMQTSQLDLYAKQYGHWWNLQEDENAQTVPGAIQPEDDLKMARAFAYMVFYNFHEINRKAIMGEDMGNFIRLYEGSSEYLNFFDDYCKGVADVVGVPFPSSDDEVKLNIILTSMHALSVLTQKEHEEELKAA